MLQCGMSNITPIFTTHHSIGHSILTADKVEKDENKTPHISDNKPVSVVAIAKVHSLPQLIVFDKDISGFWKLYKNSADEGVQLVYGVTLVACEDEKDKSEESAQTESNATVIFNNSQGYYDFVKIYTHASTHGLHDRKRRIGWAELNSRWTENLSMMIPFYSSFVARNAMTLNHRAQPVFGSIKPVFRLESHDLPFDGLIEKKLRAFCGSEHAIEQTHQIYYYKTSDVMKYLTIGCIARRTVWEKPNLEDFSSDKFSFESFQKLND